MRVGEGTSSQNAAGTQLVERLDELSNAVSTALNAEAVREASGSQAINHISSLMQALQSEALSARQQTADAQTRLDAIATAQAVIEFSVDGKAVSANNTFLVHTGYTSTNIEGRSIHQLVSESTNPSLDLPKEWASIQRGSSVVGGFAWSTRTGSELWLHGSFTPVIDGSTGQIDRVLFCGSDITESTQQLQQEKLRSTAEAKRRESEHAQVSTLLELLSKVNQGKFTIKIPDLGEGTVGSVARMLGQTVEAVRAALANVQNVSGTVASAAGEMTMAAEEISRGAQQQAARLEETSSSLEEITSTVQKNAENAKEASKLATGSRDVATQGGQVVTDAVQAMSEINDSSNKISDIITTIDEIAFQTNLLALNAAVEAARAGEQGRGFAVVAGEVRSLAQRSASSAKEIKSLIQDSARKVAKGTELVNRSGQTLGEIVTSVNQVTDIVSEIASASKEQLTSIQTVNNAVTQMDEVTQANANQTEELTGTSGSVLRHARQLAELVSAFELGQ